MIETQLNLLRKKGELMSSCVKPNSDKVRNGGMEWISVRSSRSLAVPACFFLPLRNSPVSFLSNVFVVSLGRWRVERGDF